MKKFIALLMAAMMLLSVCSFAAAESDLEYVQGKGVLVVGITDFEPMDYKDENGAWIGYDADMATLFAAALDCDVEFVEIDWDTKILELNSKAIDCVWNGMTLTDEVMSAMECSGAYMNNAQVIVIAADKVADFADVAAMSALSFAVEAGSAGEACVTELGYNAVPVTSQAAALMEVAAGTSDAAVIDALMAAAMVGEGTSYEKLTYTFALNSEEYGVGFRKGSELAELADVFFAACAEEGLDVDVASVYGVQAALIAE